MATKRTEISNPIDFVNGRRNPNCEFASPLGLNEIGSWKGEFVRNTISLYAYVALGTCGKPSILGEPGILPFSIPIYHLRL